MSSINKFEETLSTLNKIQRKAVLCEAESLQILAGPGSGKTRVLTLRVAQLVVRKNIEPSNIMVVTFTRKAANEMIERLNALIGKTKTRQLIIGTFHSVCSRILRRFNDYVGLKKDFVIIDTYESKKILGQILKDKTLVLESYVNELNAGQIFGIISKAKNLNQTAYDYAEHVDTIFKADISKLFFLYEEQLKQNNLVDYENLLLKACQVLRIKKDALSNIEAVLVDEYQDTNVVQYELLLKLDHQFNNRSLTIVGDPDQSIFGWRHAEPANFHKMREDFENTQIINMEQNYRSSRTILDSAMHVIVQDKNRFNKTLYTNNAKGIPISFISTPDEHDQAEFVAAEIKRVIKYSKGLILYKDIAVLLRMNYITLNFETTFRKHMIPYTVAKGDRFFGREEVQDILGYLRFAYNPRDSSSFSRIVSVPKRGVGAATLRKILDYAAKSKISLLEALEEIAIKRNGCDIRAEICKELVEFYGIIVEIRQQLEEATDLSEIIKWIAEAIGYEHYLKQKYIKNDEKYKEKWANVGELISLAKKFSSPKKEDTLDSSVYMSQNPTQPKEHSTANEDDIYEVKEEPDEDVIDFTTQTSQPYDSQNVIYTQSQAHSQYTEPNLDEAFQDEFHEDDDPVYNTPQTILQNFLEYCSLSSEENDEVEVSEEGKVTIATMHAAKGLEWACVFVVNCNETIVPMHNDDIDEERRVLYVAMTRSKFLLYCITPELLAKHGSARREPRSRFLNKMSHDLYVEKVPGWNNSVRRVLANTLGKSVPPDDDTLCTTDTEYDTNGEQIESMDIRFESEKKCVNLDLVMGEFMSAASLASKRESVGFEPSHQQKRIKCEQE